MPEGQHHDLHHHGDQDIADGLVDLAVNVRLPAPPEWLRDRIVKSLDGIAAYPNAAEATEAVAAKHCRPTDEVLVTAGAAEAFSLLANGIRPGRPTVVHPQFTEPEAALTAAGHRVHRALLDAETGFRLQSHRVPDDADMVVIGNPTNPTSVLHNAQDVLAMRRKGRVLVVDEAFMDAVPGEPESVADRRDDGILVIRSLTKTWGIAGLRAGYIVGDPTLIARLKAVQPPWSVSTPAAAAVVACCTDDAAAEARALAEEADRDRAHLTDGLQALGVPPAGHPRAPFVLVRVPRGERVRLALRDEGYAVRRGDTFPGLSTDWLRIAVRDRHTTDGFLAALRRVR